MRASASEPASTESSDRRRHRVRIAKRAVQAHDLRLALFDLGDNLPALRRPCGQAQRCAHQVVAANPTRMCLLGDGLTLPEPLQLGIREKHFIFRQTKTEHGRSLERLARLRPIGNSSVEREQTESRVAQQLTPLVRVDQVAGVRLRESRRPGRQDVPQPIDQHHIAALLTQIL